MPDFERLPGTIPPDGLESRAEWTPPGEGFAAELAIRLGSEAGGRRTSGTTKLALSVLAPLRPLVAPDTWDAIREELPFALREMLVTSEAHLGGPAPRLEDRRAFVRWVAERVLHPPSRTAHYVLAVLGALKACLPGALGDAVGRELPAELAALWAKAR
jgi:uncharacterized protein (DUF2267 family)